MAPGIGMIRAVVRWSECGRLIKEMAEGVDSGLVGFHLKSVPCGGGLLSMGGRGGDKVGRRPRRGDSGILSGCLEQGVSSIGT